MPIYQYRCQACSTLHEALQKVSDPPVTVCPECGGEMKKIIAPAGIIFKGSGWHVTDYSRGGGKEESKSDSKPVDSGSAEKKDGGSDTSTSKPASDGTTSSQKVA
ncbi:MAG: FmdB family zinc ribbon protein [Candidatus Xenobia bacterium]